MTSGQYWLGIDITSNDLSKMRRQVEERMKKEKKEWPKDVLEGISDALTGYLVLQEQCGLWPAYTEYMLYDPIVRVCHSRKWSIQSEVDLPNRTHTTGDKERIDFCLFRGRKPQKREPKRSLLLEVKYRRRMREKRVRIENDCRKLQDMLADSTRFARSSRAFILVAGRKSHSAKQTEHFPIKPRLGKLYCGSFFKAARATFSVEVYEVLRNRAKALE